MPVAPPKRLQKQLHLIRYVHNFDFNRRVVGSNKYETLRRGTTWCNRNGWLGRQRDAIVCEGAHHIVYITDRDPTCINCIRMKQRTEEKSSADQ